MIEIRHVSDRAVRVTPYGELGRSGGAALLRVVSDFSIAEVEMVIDLAHVPVIDTLALRALAASVHRVKTLGGRVSVRNPRPSVRWRIDYFGLGDQPPGRMPASREVLAVGSSSGHDAA
jgi:anti-anti-sigma regulatory factor